LGYDEGEREITVQPEARRFAVILRDKHAGKDADGTYDYGWYMTPQEVETSTYKELLIVKDDLLQEVALYEFSNAEGFRSLDNAQNGKVLSYNTEEIYRQIKTLLPESEKWGTKAVINADVFTNITSFVNVKYPSNVFGLKSTGHGTPRGIMNGFLSRDYLIRRSLALVKDMRGRSIDFIDLNTNCNAGSYYNFSSLAPYADYFMASDLTRMPSNTDDYYTFFSNPGTAVKDILSNIMEREDRMQRESDFRKNHLMQVTLFDNKEFVKILNKLGDDFGTKLQEVYEGSAKYGYLYYAATSTNQVDFETGVAALVPDYGSFRTDWNRAIIKQMDNRSYVNAGTRPIYEAKGLILKRW
jgi:hypothetical protein